MSGLPLAGQAGCRVPPDRLPTLEQRMDDVRAVLDVAGSQPAARTRGRSAWPSWRPPPAISTSSTWPTRSGPSWDHADRAAALLLMSDLYKTRSASTSSTPRTNHACNETYPDSTYRRLVDIKRRYGPNNLFHRNLNIRPA
jgi:hypothetical protein